MYTQCPQCMSVFSLDARTVAQAHGFVMCGHCGEGFDSIATLADVLPPEPFTELPINEPGIEPPHLELAVYRPKPVVVVETPASPSESAHGPVTAFDDLLPSDFAPRFVREHASRTRRWPWVVSTLLLLLLLAAQLGWALRDQLVADATVGPVLQQACLSLGCQLPLVQDVKQLRLLARDVQAHPSVPGALLISATVRNEAHFAQPYPVVSITLSDVDGKRIALRRLRPAEYVADSYALQHGLPPGANTAIVLEVEDPGSKAVAFELGFE
ncbi:zinc-ribbon and DUF3426 domain-containing protein [Dyella sp.]|uniref:zinc-ribbon and DUF3426 domain-containing protein n=1 Tax=Dyella sp. TaxID=1869338 RepID=UPI002ED5C2C3